MRTPLIITVLADGTTYLPGYSDPSRKQDGWRHFGLSAGRRMRLDQRRISE
jgi:hypothetical protein